MNPVLAPGQKRPVKLAVAQPVEGSPETARVCYAVQQKIRQLGNVVLLDDKTSGMGPVITGNVDVSRARDRLARVFLHEVPECTHLLWWDEDVLPDDLQIINHMLATGYDCVGVPYRKKTEAESYPYRFIGPAGGAVNVEVHRGCVEVEHLAFGFMLTSRECLARMWDMYKDERWHFDTYEGTAYETVGMFDLIYSPVMPGPDGTPYRVKYSEDFAFCESYRAIGGRVMMYVGPGSPAGHIGSTVYRGSVDGLVHGAHGPARDAR
jgi:hypothetical protein